MCEIFGISSSEKIKLNGLLSEFYSHSTENPDGWGLAAFYGNAVSLEKEPISAAESSYLKNRLTEEITEDTLLAHIRKASVGNIAYKNTHPFTLRDDTGRMWTLIHNGTISDCPAWKTYTCRQKGDTDSEKILYYLIDKIHAKQEEKQRALTEEERFWAVDEVIHEITPNNNKVNLLIYDGSLFYVHTNHDGSLKQYQKGKTLLVSTKPLTQEPWENVPLNTLMAYRRGVLVYTGKRHANEKRPVS